MRDGRRLAKQIGLGIDETGQVVRERPIARLNPFNPLESATECQ
jgi:hypothetical protein